MIYEFALHPKLVAQWHDRKEYLFFNEKFDIRYGRVISQYPKRWKKLVWQEFSLGSESNNQNAEGRLSALLEQLCLYSVKRQSSFVEVDDWLERTEKEHRLRPFRAILSLKNPRANPAVLTLEELQDGKCDLWFIPECGVVDRTPEALAEAVKPLLRISKEITFVDPYFNPRERRFRKTLRAFLSILKDSVHLPSKLKISLCTSLERYFKGSIEWTPEEEKRVFHKFRNDCEKLLPSLVPKDLCLKIVIFKKKPFGEKLHNRYILTDVAGAIFGTGLDMEDTGDASSFGGQGEDIALLSQSQYLKRLSQYRIETEAFHQIYDPVSIVSGKG